MMRTKTFNIAALLCSLLLAGLVVGCHPDDAPDGPNEPDNTTPGRVVMNEVNSLTKYIELYNAGDQSVDLSGWKIRKNNEEYLSNADGTGDYVVPSGTILPGGEFAVLGCKGNTIEHTAIDLGVSQSGISGKKSLLLELVDAKGKRIDYFVNSHNEVPKASDYWDDKVERNFDVAARITDGTDAWWIADRQSPGRSNNDSTPVIQFFNYYNMDWTGSGIGSSDDREYAEARDYVFDIESMPKITVSIEEEEWNNLLQLYDRNSKTKQYVHCDVNFQQSGTDEPIYAISDAGLRLRGNTSRRRPEGNGGEMHKVNDADWHHCHFGINLRKFVKDKEHTINGVRKMNLKWFKDDPTYVRELYCYDLFRRFDIWTALHTSYCRLYIHVDSDKQPAYYGVYHLMEAIDDEYLSARVKDFGGDKGNLWKGRYGANLRDTYDHMFGYDDGGDQEWIYELKSDNASFDVAKAQLKDFIHKLNNLEGDEFHDWIAEVTDVELLLRTYAVNVIVGMWDDYWNNKNNYYFYFNSTSTTDYKFFFIPYDYDNTLGTSNHCGVQSDAGTQNPLRWGNTDDSPLIGKILEFDDYKAIYLAALRELISPQNDLFHLSKSSTRISNWQKAISPAVDNDTGEDCSISDRPAGWGSTSHYRLLGGDDKSNFFMVKAASIP